MTSPAAGPLRVLRATALTALLLALGSVAHAIGGGGMPPPLVLAVVGIVLTPVVLTATRVRLGPVRAGLYLAGSQLGIHLLLHSMHPARGTSTAGPHVHGGDAAVLAAAHSSGALGASGDMAGMVGMAEMPPDALSLGLTPTMLLAHTVATVVTAWVIARGEEVLWRVICLLIPVAPRQVRVPGRATTLVTTELRPLLEAAVSGPLGSRAPPVAPA